MKNKKFPSSDEIKSILSDLEQMEGSQLLPEDASLVDKMKFELCKSFIIYKREHELSQKDLADLLEIDQAVMSKILHYRIEDFTIDRLVRILNILQKDISIKIA